MRVFIMTTTDESLGHVDSDQVPRVGETVAIGEHDYDVERVGWWHWGPSSVTLIVSKARVKEERAPKDG